MKKSMCRFSIALASAAVFILCYTPASAQYASARRTTTPTATHSAARQASGKAFPTWALQVNPLGLLQFGPIVQAEFKVSEQGHYLAPHVRFPYFGVLYHVTTIDGEDDVTVSPGALGLGIGYKKLFANAAGAWYIGGALDYSFGKSESDGRVKWDNEFSYLNLMANGGWRWRNPDSRFVFGVGAFLGPSIALKDDTTYTDGRVEDERESSFLGMLELTLGWEY
jgi:hypothetical protein